MAYVGKLTQTHVARGLPHISTPPAPPQDMAHGRRIPAVDELRQLPLCHDARLRRCEIVAVLLYTGPMVRRCAVRRKR